MHELQVLQLRRSSRTREHPMPKVAERARWMVIFQKESVDFLLANATDLPPPIGTMLHCILLLVGSFIDHRSRSHCDAGYPEVLPLLPQGVRVIRGLVWL